MKKTYTAEISQLNLILILFGASLLSFPCFSLLFLSQPSEQVLSEELPNQKISLLSNHLFYLMLCQIISSPLIYESWWNELKRTNRNTLPCEILLEFPYHRRKRENGFIFFLLLLFLKASTQYGRLQGLIRLH